MLRYKALFNAVGRVYLHNRTLIINNGKVRCHYVQGAALPEDGLKLSEALRCETNGAHKSLEDVISCVKELGRENVPRRVIEHWLAGSSNRLLNDLRDLSELLPRLLERESDQLRHAIEDARDVEDALTNFILCRSGGDRWLSSEQVCVRLDKFVRDLKHTFNRIVRACDDIEVAAARRRRLKPSARVKTRRTGDSLHAFKHSDRVAILREVSRRLSAKRERRLEASAKAELAALYRDEAWARRCRQWKFETLYTYWLRK